MLSSFTWIFVIITMVLITIDRHHTSITIDEFYIMHFFTVGTLIMSMMILGIDIFINLPMNGIYRLPGNWAKDTTIVYGLAASIIIPLGVIYGIIKSGLHFPPYILLITLPYIYLSATGYANLALIIK